MLRRRSKRGASTRAASQAQAENRQRRWRSAGSGAVLLASALGCGWAGQQLLEPERFPLREVQVYGELRHAPGAELRELLAPYLGQNFFALDIAGLHARLAANPWLAAVAVRRQWPDRLLIEVRERHVFGHWGEHELIDISGQRFRPRYPPQRALGPVLMGPDGQEAVVMGAYQRASGILAPLGLSVTHLIQDQRLAWRLTLDNGLTLILSKDDAGTERFVQQLRRLHAVYSTVLAPQLARITLVDLRYERGFTVRWAAAAKVSDSWQEKPDAEKS